MGCLFVIYFGGDTELMALEKIAQEKKWKKRKKWYYEIWIKWHLKQNVIAYWRLIIGSKWNPALNFFL